MPSDSARKLQERADLVRRIIKNGFEMVACSNCVRRNRTCISSPSDSSKCAGCVQRKLKCDQVAPSHGDWVKLEREEDRLDREEEETLAKLMRLRRQKKLLCTRGKEMLRRGLSTLDELDQVEERERLEAEAKQKALEATPPEPPHDPSLDFVGVASVDDSLLSPSFWEAFEFSGEIASGGPDS